MKPRFNNAPDFSLPMENGTFHLSDLEGRHRVALLFPRDEPEARATIAQIQRGAMGWSERDLVLVLVVPGEGELLDMKPPGVFIARDERGEVARQFGALQGETAFFLLGKINFPVALAVDYVPADAEIFSLIDAMPMRKREMRENNRAL